MAKKIQISIIHQNLDSIIVISDGNPLKYIMKITDDENPSLIEGKRVKKKKQKYPSHIMKKQQTCLI